MYRERSIKSPEELKTVLEALDEDEGVRIVGKVEGYAKGGILFVTYTRGQYCINISDGSRHDNPGDKRKSDEFRFFDSFEKMWWELDQLMRKPVSAVAY